MSRLARKRRSLRWARMFNRFGHIPSAAVGGWAAIRAMHPRVVGRSWMHVRHQQPHRYGKGYRNA